MKGIVAGAAAVLLIVAAAAYSVPGGPQAAPGTNAATDVALRVEDRNPFTDKPFDADPRNFQFAIVSDRTGGHRPGVFGQGIDKLNLMQPEFVVSVGDLIEGYTEDPAKWEAEWSEFMGLVDRLEMPFFLCVGNHDYSNLKMSAEWRRRFGRGHYEFVYRDVLFLVLNSEEQVLRPDNANGKNKKYAYGFGQEQQDWVARTLDRHRDVRWTFVFLHKPVWTYYEDDPAALGWASIEDALQGRQYTVFAGHKHNYAKFVRKGREHYMLATTGGSSKLLGRDEGQFDHFVWVTMKDQGPVVANLLLDGIESRDVRTLGDEPPPKKPPTPPANPKSTPKDAP